MYSEEETELRDAIIQNLEKSGYMDKLKAQLRAGVFLALEENGNLKNKIPHFNKEFHDFSETSDGKLILSLIKDFLEFFNLKFTLSVFEPEIATKTPCMSRSETCERLKVSSDINSPLISELLKEKFNHVAHCSSTEEIQSDVKKVVNSIHDISSDSSSLSFSKSNVDKDIKIACVSSEKDLVKSEGAIKNITDIPDVFSNPGTVSKDAKDINVLESTKEIVEDKSCTIGSNNALSADHDPFFDEPLPSEKASFFTFSDTFKEKPVDKPSEVIKDDQSKSSLASLKDLPSLTADNEWLFTREPKNAFPSLDSQKSVSSSEASNEEVINLDPKETFQKKEVDSNEESSEKPISEESIEEEIEEDFSAGFDDLLNSSLSLADDATTDQTVSQTSVVEGVDHVEPCK